MHVKIATANRLTDGLVVFLSNTGHWIGEIENGRTASTAAEEADLQLASETEASSNVVVGPYVIDAELRDDGPHPTRYREWLRLNGPSVETQIHEETKNVSL
jgi:hypothetical protein